jgi:DNA-binding response OmpR family regulator
MKTYHSNLMPIDSRHLLPTSLYPPPARICEPPKTLLVVDDEPMLRNVETEVLRLHGYTVLEAENAAEAMRVATATKTIHLLVTDYWMPEVNGLELTRRFRAVHPKTPVLMVSGSLPMIKDRADDLERFAILAKPFQFNELLHKVRTLLDATAPLPIRRSWHCD